MAVSPLFGFLCASLDDFLAKPLDVVRDSGATAVAILDANQPLFYVISPNAWREMSECNGTAWASTKSTNEKNAEELDQFAVLEGLSVATQKPKVRMSQRPDAADSVLTRGALRANNFDVLAEQLIEHENQRVQRAELSAASVGILKNRLDAHVLPFFKWRIQVRTATRFNEA